MDGELDVARLVAIDVGPRLQARLDNICTRVLNQFKRGKLSQEELTELAADYRATVKLMNEINLKIGGR